MSAIDKLLSISSPETGGRKVDILSELPSEIMSLLEKRNGFQAFESSLEIFHLSDGGSYSIFEWNSPSLWIEEYRELRPSGICFAQDIFGGQFVYRNGVSLFDPETGDISPFSESIEQWAERILHDYKVVTGQPIAHSWQVIHGPIQPNHRLIPLIPFVLGGDFSADNVVSMEAAKSMRLRANLARQLCNLPDGAQVVYEVTD